MSRKKNKTPPPPPETRKEYRSKAFSYDLLTKGGSVSRPEPLTYNPSFVIAVIPFKKLTFVGNVNAKEEQVQVGRTEVTKKGKKSVVTNEDELMATDSPQLIEKYCVQCTVSSTKRSPQGEFSGMFLDPDGDLMTRFNPEDWLFVWMTDNTEDAVSIRKKVLDLTPANDFHEGLKFVGRVSSLRKVVQVQGNGTISKRVSITGQSFAEFSSDVYFDPALIVGNEFGTAFMANLAKSLSAISNKEGVMYTMSAIPLFFHLFIGSGPPGNLRTIEAVVKGAGSKSKMISPNRALLVPDAVASLLGRTVHSNDKQHHSYAGIMNCIYGIQHYGETDIDTQFLNTFGGAPSEAVGFFPKVDATNKKTGKIDPKTQSYTGTPVRGKFNAQITPWAGVPIWSVFQQFLNPVVNEIYCTLRVGIDGKIEPHFILRQIPFTTDDFALKYKGTSITRFTSLPRWKVDPMLVTQYNIGKSSGLRVNFVQVRGQPLVSNEVETSLVVIRIDPELDRGDISRSGLKTSLATINAEVSEVTQGESSHNRIYTLLSSDFMFGSHLKYTGSFSLKGIQDPICIGDNMEFDGVIYHIEQLTHTITIAPNGVKAFDTNIVVSNGVSAFSGLPPEIAPLKDEPEPEAMLLPQSSSEVE